MCVLSYLFLYSYLQYVVKDVQPINLPPAYFIDNHGYCVNYDDNCLANRCRNSSNDAAQQGRNQKHTMVPLAAAMQSISHTCQPPEYKNLETSKNLCIVRISFSTISEYSPKTTRGASECSRRFSIRTAIAIVPITTPTFYTYCAVWLADFWPITVLIKYRLYQFDCSVLCFPNQNSTNESTNIHFLFYFPFWHLEDNEINEQMLKKAMLKKAMVGISREIWRSNRETGRFDEKFGDSRENRESWQVWYPGMTVAADIVSWLSLILLPLQFVLYASLCHCLLKVLSCFWSGQH